MLLEDLLAKDPRAPELLCRAAAYAEPAQLLRDLLAMANLAHPGPRWIVVGLGPDTSGRWRLTGMDAEQLRILQQALREVGPLVEPACEINPTIAERDGRRYALIEIDACDEPPYVARRQLAPDMRTGACWVRDGDEIRPARRQDLERIYAARRPAPPFRLGFGDNPTCQELILCVPDSSHPPSSSACMLRRAWRMRGSSAPMRPMSRVAWIR